MTDTTSNKLPDACAQLVALIARQGLTEDQAVSLLNVPLSTLRKWTKGERTPSAAAARLVAILSILEALAPHVLASLRNDNPA